MVCPNGGGCAKELVPNERVAVRNKGSGMSLRTVDDSSETEL